MVLEEKSLVKSLTSLSSLKDSVFSAPGVTVNVLKTKSRFIFGFVFGSYGDLLVSVETVMLNF